MNVKQATQRDPQKFGKQGGLLALTLWPPPTLGMGPFGAQKVDRNGPVGKLRSPVRRMGTKNGPFFHGVCRPWGGRKTWHPEITKVKQNTKSITEKCMLFEACVFTKLLLAQGKVHIAKVHVFQNGLLHF